MDDPVLKHFRNPQNVGELPGAHGFGQGGNPGCGAVVRIFISFDGQTIGQARFLATGSSAAIAAGSVLTGLITGKAWLEAAAVSQEAVEAQLGLPSGAGENGSRRRAAIHSAAAFAVEALHGALEGAVRHELFPAARSGHANTVLVAMSGGVDSSVACLLQKQAGRNVIGLTMRLWSDPSCQGSGVSCCSPQAVRDARRVCHTLGLPHLTVDFSEEFEKAVVDHFVSEYMAGRTPNPCTRCNGWFRFPALLNLAGKLGAGRVATGHYARVTNDVNGTPLLSTGVDKAKDQSYMLWGVGHEMLGSLDFPLGTITKAETRRLARAASLPSHSSPESQEVCFIPDDNYRRFLRSRVDQLPQSGDIVDTGGNRLGTHTGYIDYTVGQRRGLGLAAPEPLYVLETRPGENRVIAGTREQLAVSRIEVGSLNILSPDVFNNGSGLQVQVRYNSSPVPARIKPGDHDRCIIELGNPVYGVAPGQSAVLYDGDRVAGGGVILSSRA